jgi:uncharacterized membrane protein YkvA (DUF1232 family)
MLARLKRWAGLMARDLRVLGLVARDRRVPWHAKAVAVATLAYAFSPIDLVPDFIPVLGQIDDLLLVPLGIALAIWQVPAAVMQDLRRRAGAPLPSPDRGRFVAAAAVVILWLAGAAAILCALRPA